MRKSALELLLVSVSTGGGCVMCSGLAVVCCEGRQWHWGSVCPDQGCVSADARHPPEVLLGDDLCLRSLGELRGLWGPGQHLLHLQPENPGGQRPREPGAAGAHRSALLLLLLLLLLQGNSPARGWAVCACACAAYGPPGGELGCCSCILTFSHYSWVKTLHNCSVFRILVLLSLPR